MDYFYLGAGLFLLIVGGNILVQGAVALATRLGITPLLVGLVVVGFGTSAPELVASLTAALQGSPGIAVGNVVGSNIANVLLIIGIGAMIAPMASDPRSLRRDGAMMLGAALALAAVVLAGKPMDLPVGVAFLVVLFAYLVYSYLSDRRSNGPAAELHREEAALLVPKDGQVPRPLPLLLLALAAGLAGVVFGADLLVTGAIAIARGLQISETIIGLTVVAVGTSLPELATAIIAARRGHGDVALGNILGSNIFNVLGILGVTAVVTPIAIPGEIARLDLWVMLGATCLLLLFAASGRRIARGEAAVFLLLYLGYYGLLFYG